MCQTDSREAAEKRATSRETGREKKKIWSFQETINIPAHSETSLPKHTPKEKRESS